MWPWPAVLHSLPPSYPIYLYMLLSRLPLRSSSGLVRWPVPRVGFTALELEYRENKLPINELNIQIRGHPSQNTKSEELQSHTSVIRLSVGTLENLGMKGSFGESSFSVSRWWQPPARWDTYEVSLPKSQHWPCYFPDGRLSKAHFPTPKGLSLVPQTVKNPSMMRETWVQSLGWADPLEKGMATHSSILAWRISWTEEPGRLQSMVSQRVGHDWETFTFSFKGPLCSGANIPFLSHLPLVVRSTLDKS